MSNSITLHEPFEPTMPCPVCKKNAVQLGMQRQYNNKDHRIVYLAWHVRCLHCQQETFRYGVFSDHPFTSGIVKQGGILSPEQVQELMRGKDSTE